VTAGLETSGMAGRVAVHSRHPAAHTCRTAAVTGISPPRPQPDSQYEETGNKYEEAGNICKQITVISAACPYKHAAQMIAIGLVFDRLRHTPGNLIAIRQ